jgi:hypothetical protein
MNLAQKVRQLPKKVLKLRSAYQTCFSGVAGETVLRDLYKFCNAMQPTHVMGNEYETAFNEGKRRVFLRIFHQMKIHDERKMLKQLEEMRDE